MKLAPGRRVLEAALSFWNEASRDRRISEGFRVLCASNALGLQRWGETWAASA